MDRTGTRDTRRVVLISMGVVVALLLGAAWIVIAHRDGAGSSGQPPGETSTATESGPEPGSGRGGHGGGGAGGGGSDGGGSGVGGTGEQGETEGPDGGAAGSDGPGEVGGGGSGNDEARFTTFDYVAEVDCTAWTGPGKPPLSLVWVSEGAVEAYWRGGDQDPGSADAATGYPAPVAGDQADLAIGGEARGEFGECGHREHYFVVITLVGPDGRTQSRTASFRDISWGTGEQAEITTFAGPATATCLAPQAPAYEPTVPLTFSWEVVDAAEIAFGIGTDDAVDAPYETGLPDAGSLTVTFGCDLVGQTYTLTAVGADAVRVSRTITVVNPSAQA